MRHPHYAEAFMESLVLAGGLIQEKHSVMIRQVVTVALRAVSPVGNSNQSPRQENEDSSYAMDDAAVGRSAVELRNQFVRQRATLGSRGAGTNLYFDILLDW
jgi:hypothetical protein